MRGEFKTMTRHVRIIFSALVVMGVMAVPLAAQAMDWYGGLSYGQDRAQATGGDLLGGGFSGSIDNNHSGWKALAGMELWDKYVAAEFGYVDLGENHARGTVSGSYSAGTSQSKAYTASVVGYIPIAGQFGAIIRLGVAGERTTVTTSGTLGTGAHATGQDSDLKLFSGFGLQYDFSKRMAARVEVEHYTMGSIGSPYIDLYSAGLIYRFGR
ncbi:MAG: outer membrane beta-barrel protein [Sulfuricaulis sp.]